MSTPDRKMDILKRLGTTHDELHDQVMQIPPERMTQPGVNGDWTVKDVLAHITWWEQHLLRRLHTGQDDLFTPNVNPREATDRANAEVYVANRDRPLDAIRAEFASSYREVQAELEALPANLVTHDETYEIIAVDTFEHYPEHTAMLRGWLAGTTGPLPEQSLAPDEAENA